MMPPPAKILAAQLGGQSIALPLAEVARLGTFVPGALGPVATVAGGLGEGRASGAVGAATWLWRLPTALPWEKAQWTVEATAALPAPVALVLDEVWGVVPAGDSPTKPTSPAWLRPAVVGAVWARGTALPLVQLARLWPSPTHALWPLATQALADWQASSRSSATLGQNGVTLPTLHWSALDAVQWTEAVTWLTAQRASGEWSIGPLSLRLQGGWVGEAHSPAGLLADSAALVRALVPLLPVAASFRPAPAEPSAGWALPLALSRQ